MEKLQFCWRGNGGAQRGCGGENAHGEDSPLHAWTGDCKVLEPLPLAAGLPSGQDSGGEEGTAARPWAARAFVRYWAQSRRGIEREGLPDLECGILNFLNSVSGQFGMAGLLKFHLPISFADFRSVEYQSASISQPTRLGNFNNNII